MFVVAGEVNVAQRRVYFMLVDVTDGITPETGEAGGQPQISSDGAAWTNVGIGVLVAIGNGRYYADLTAAAVASAGTTIETRYKSANTAECPGDTVRVINVDLDGAPWAVSGDVTSVGPVISSEEVALVRGDDYFNADGRALTFSSTGWPDLTGVISLSFTGRGDPSDVIGFITTGSAVMAGSSSQTVRFEVASSQTINLGAGAYKFDVAAVLSNAHKATLAIGSLTLYADMTRTT